MDTLDQRIQRFLDGEPFAVVGASTDRAKYGNKVLRVYQQQQRRVYPINPKADRIEGLQAFGSLGDVPEAVHGVSIITPPAVTEKVVLEAAGLGIRHIWMQPGAESDTAIAIAREADINLIAGDACVLVVLGYREEA